MISLENVASLLEVNSIKASAISVERWDTRQPTVAAKGIVKDRTTTRKTPKEQPERESSKGSVTIVERLDTERVNAGNLMANQMRRWPIKLQESMSWRSSLRK